MLLEVVRLEQLDTLLRNSLVQLLLGTELLISLEQKVNYSAGAVSCLIRKRRLHTLEHGFLLLVKAPKLVIREVAVAALVLAVWFEHVLTVKNVDVGLR